MKGKACDRSVLDTTSQQQSWWKSKNEAVHQEAIMRKVKRGNGANPSKCSVDREKDYKVLKLQHSQEYVDVQIWQKV